MRLTLLALISVFCIGFVRSNSFPNLFQRNSGADVPSISIVGGTPASSGEFPFLSVLQLGGSLCGGSLIGSKYILTAAHCVDGMVPADVSSFTVFLNTLSIDGGGTGSLTRGVTKFVMHPSYVPSTQDNDVAMLILDSPVTTIKFVPLPSDSSVTTRAPATTQKTTTKPVTTKPAITTTLKSTTKTTTKITTKTPCSCTCAPTAKPVVVNGQTTKKPAASKSFSTYENQVASIAGWGTTSSGGSVSDVLLKATVTIQPNTVCASQYSNFVSAHMLCASAAGKDTCQGDSGGPILVNGTQVGVTSFGIGCASPDYAGVYARVSAYLSWIQSTMASNP